MSEDQTITKEPRKTDSVLRNKLQELLENGLSTEVEPRAYTQDAIMAVISELQKLEDTDYTNKLAIAGFTLLPYTLTDEDEQACETCMYYRVHQRFCELPELMIPVEPQWSCRLWRI